MPDGDGYYNLLLFHVYYGMSFRCIEVLDMLSNIVRKNGKDEECTYCLMIKLQALIIRYTLNLFHHLRSNLFKLCESSEFGSPQSSTQLFSDSMVPKVCDDDVCSRSRLLRQHQKQVLEWRHPCHLLYHYCLLLY